MDRDFRSLFVADLANEYDVRILTQNRSQACGERQVDLGVDFDLTNTRLLNFNRILDRHDVFGGVIDACKRRVQGGRLTTTRRSRDEENAIGTLHDAPKNVELCR